MKFGLPDHILHAIIRELHKRENITRAVIFGSRASNDYKYNSDIDLAVYWETAPGTVGGFGRGGGFIRSMWWT